MPSTLSRAAVSRFGWSGELLSSPFSERLRSCSDAFCAALSLVLGSSSCPDAPVPSASVQLQSLYRLFSSPRVRHSGIRSVAARVRRMVEEALGDSLLRC